MLKSSKDYSDNLKVKLCVKFLIVFLLLITPAFAQEGETLQESEQPQTIQITEKSPKSESKDTEEKAENKRNKKQKTKKEKSPKERNTPKTKTEKAKQDKTEDSEFALFEFVKEYSEYEQVLYWKEEFLKERRFKFLKKAVEEYPEYRVFVRKTVREMGLPAELEYLPVIESGYNIRARSRSGAVGMWQFMANSVRPYLKLTEYIDERLDPWKSTVAGLKKLEYNYKLYGDWFLALAAYNCGVGKMNKAIKKSGGQKDFWVLAKEGHIPRQTADYIPELIAVTEICLNPKKFNVELKYYREEYEAFQSQEENYDFVTVKKPYMLSSIAKEMELEEAEIKKLNPAYTKNFTQPFGESVLRLPKGMKETFETILANLKEVEIPFKYKVKQGDSLWSISRRYGVTIKQICDLNGIKEKSILKINQILYIPAVK